MEGGHQTPEWASKATYWEADKCQGSDMANQNCKGQGKEAVKEPEVIIWPRVLQLTRELLILYLFNAVIPPLCRIFEAVQEHWNPGRDCNHRNSDICSRSQMPGRKLFLESLIYVGSSKLIGNYSKTHGKDMWPFTWAVTRDINRWKYGFPSANWSINSLQNERYIQPAEKHFVKSNIMIGIR